MITSKRVKPSAEYFEQGLRPRGHGTIIRMDEGDCLAVVQWDGVSTPQEIHIDYLEDADAFFVPPPPRQSRSKNYEAKVAQRKFLRRAFDVIRHDETQAELVKVFAQTLGGKLPWSQEVLEQAAFITGEQIPSHPSSGREKPHET